jgi:hypothetical protein
MIKAKVLCSVGAATIREFTLEFPDGTHPRDIEYACSDAAREKFWWSHEIITDDPDEEAGP